MRSQHPTSSTQTPTSAASMATPTMSITFSPFSSATSATTAQDVSTSNTTTTSHGNATNAGMRRSLTHRSHQGEEVSVGKDQMLRQLVCQIVATESSTPRPHPMRSGHALAVEQHNRVVLQRYFHRHRDLVYTEIIKRAGTECHNTLILGKCVDLLKGNLRKHVPSVSGLIQIDRFCRWVQQNENIKKSNAKLNRTLKFVRDLIQELVQRRASSEELEQWEQHDRQMDDQFGNPFLQQSRQSLNAYQSVNKMPPRTHQSMPSTSSASTSLSSSPRHHHSHIDRFMISNLYQWRCLASPIRSLSVEIDVPSSLEGRYHTLLDSVYFGGQFRKVTKFEDKQPEIDMSSCIRLNHVKKNNKHIDAVRRIKEEQRKDKSESAPISTTSQASHALPLFDSHDTLTPDSKPLVLKESELQGIFDSALNPLDRENNTQALGKVTKLLYDVFMSDNTPAIGQTATFFFEMLQSGYSRIRRNAFHLLYNLRVALQTNSLHEHKLYMFLCNLTCQLYFNNEKSNSVWSASMACFLCFVSDPHSGKVNLQRIEQYDIRAIAKYLSILKDTMQDENQHTQLVSILANHLYTPIVSDQSTINFDKLRHIGGISFIIDHYLHSKSLQGRQNLYCIIFDYIVHSMEQRKKSSVDMAQVHILFEILHRADAAVYLVQVFKYVPDRFLENFARFVFLNLLVRQKVLSQFKANVDQHMIISFVYELRNLAVNYLSMEEEFSTESNRIFSLSQIRSAKFDTKCEKLVALMRTLIDSKDERERANGEAMLFSIFKAIEESPMKKEIAPLRADIDRVMDSLCQSENEQSRTIFLNVIEKVLFLYRSKFQSHGDERIRFCIKLLNENMLKFLTAKESHVRQLLKMFYIILDFISMYDLPDSQELPSKHYSSSNSGEEHTARDGVIDLSHVQQVVRDRPELLRSAVDDDVLQLFLDGHLVVADHLLRDINISILHHLFIYFSLAVTEMRTRATKCLCDHVENARVILLNFIIDKCCISHSVLDSIGGMSFFRALLSDGNPAVVLFAAQYIMKQLSLSAPDQYFAYLRQLVFKAQEKNNPELLENPYMLLKTLADQQQAAK